MTPLFVLGLVLSAGIGLSLGLIGGGGSIITVPMLVYLLGVTPRAAVGMSLAVVGATAIVSASLHHRKGAVAWRTGAVFAASGMPAAYLGSKLTRLVSPRVLLLVFAGLMLVVAAVMLTRAARHEHVRKAKVGREVASGAGVGLLTGFLGVGGGFLIVPSLHAFGGLALKDAIGTSLFVIAVNCAAGLLGHLSDGVTEWRLTLVVALLAALGAIVGTALSHRFHPKGLRRIFAWFVVAVAVFLIVKNY